jgi:hypothetical protein
VDPSQRLQSRIRDGEQLLWHGVPDQQVRFSRVDAILLYLAVSSAPGLVFWCYWSFTRNGGPVPYGIAVLPVVGWLYFPVGRLFYRRYSRPRTSYGITTLRALIVGPNNAREKPLQDQPVTIRRSRDSRHATATIGAAPARARGSGQPVVFEDVADPDPLLAAFTQAGARLAP